MCAQKNNNNHHIKKNQKKPKKQTNIFLKNTKNPPPPNKTPHKCTHKWKPLFLSAGSAPFVVKCLMFVLVYKCTYVKWKFKVD